VPDLANRSLRLVYPSAGGVASAAPDDLVARGEAAQQEGYLNNSELGLELGDPGLEALVDRQLGRNLVRQGANVSLPGSDLSVRRNRLSASSLSGDLRIYNGSPELLVQEGPAAFHLEDLPSVYVLKGNRTLSVDSGFDRTFSTRALAVTENPSSPGSGGLVFAGDLSADVKDAGPGVDVDVSFSDRLRVRVVDGLPEAFRRSLAEKGHARFGPPGSFRGARVAEISELASLNPAEFRDRLGIGRDLSYNISLGDMESVSEPEWNGSFDGTAARDGDLVLDTAADSASYTQSYSVDSAAVTKVTVSGVQLPEGVLLELGLETRDRDFTRTVSNGTQVFRFDTGPAESFEISLESSRTGGDGNWTVGSYEALYGNALRRGANLPPRQDVDVETEVLPLLQPNGTVSASVLRVRTWR
jgi:hypothetical protein